jgi:putative multiple sugar transport system ATP-binding protein
MADRYPKREPVIGEPVMEVKDWTVYHHEHSERQVVKGVNLTVRKGEVVGISGLMGAGRTELAMSIFGRSYGQRISGHVSMHGKEVDLSTIPRALANGLAYVTEDRKQLGLILEEDIMKNITLSNLAGVSKNSVIDDIKELRVANDYRRRLNIRSPNVLQKTVNLSGGNQQKVVISKWLFADPELLILDEPTRGIDVGAKADIQRKVAELSAAGLSVIFISSELEEVLRLAQRVVVMRDRREIGQLDSNRVGLNDLIDYIANTTDGSAA